MEILLNYYSLIVLILVLQFNLIQGGKINRNETEKSQKIEINNTESSTYRNRRLIPYTTFYISGLQQPINQDISKYDENQYTKNVENTSKQNLYSYIPVRFLPIAPNQNYYYPNSAYTPVPQIYPQQYTPYTTENYLKFRYSDIFRSRYETTQTPVVTITSPKPKSAYRITVSSPSAKVVTTPYKNYPKTPSQIYPTSPTFEEYFPTTPQPRKVVSKPTTMSIVKSQEIPLDSLPSHQNPSLNSPNILIPQTSNQHEANNFNVFPTPYDDVFLNPSFKQLPEKITPYNIKESIKTLTYILKLLHEADSLTLTEQPPIYNTKGIFNSLKGSPLPFKNQDLQNIDHDNNNYDTYDEHNNNDDDGTNGRPGIEYPVHSFVPTTSFSCKTQRYKGFFADLETNCQVWHYCDLNGGQASFLCPNGTIFNQASLTCDWWFNVKCASTPQLYVLNERLYKYIIPTQPSFPEDFSGPLVDQYLTKKLKETQTKNKHIYPDNSTSTEVQEESTSEFFK